MSEPEAGAALLAHNVYFSLHDASPEARARLLAAVRQYLSGHPGVLFFACGTLAGELRRDVNDRDFDVALHIVFRDRAAHDHYQGTPEHLQFIAENRHNWRRVRVFDSGVERVGAEDRG
jgi:hypothetical protein